MQVVDLALGRLDDDLGVDQAGRPHDLLDDLARHLAARTGRAWPTGTPPGSTRSMNSSNRSGRLSAADGSRKPCSMSVSLRERSPSYWPCSCGTATWLSSSTTRKSSGKKSSSVCGGSPGPRPSIGRRVVLDAVAEADLLHHLEVVLGAHAQALRLEQLALLLELGQPLLQLGLDARRWPSRIRSSPAT